MARYGELIEGPHDEILLSVIAEAAVAKRVNCGGLIFFAAERAESGPRSSNIRPPLRASARTNRGKKDVFLLLRQPARNENAGKSRAKKSLLKRSGCFRVSFELCH
jgi:hypothetical protein